MCLAIPAKVLKIHENGLQAQVGQMGVTCWIGISLVPDVTPGDYVLVHAGEAIYFLDEREALKTLEIWEELYAANRKPLGHL